MRMMCLESNVASVKPECQSLLVLADPPTRPGTAGAVAPASNGVTVAPAGAAEVAVSAARLDAVGVFLSGGALRAAARRLGLMDPA